MFIKCFFSHIQIQITATMLNVEPLFLMYFYSVNGSSEMLIINVNWVGSSFPEGVFHCLHVNSQVKKKMGKDTLSSVSCLLSWLSLGINACGFPVNWRSAQQCLQFVCFSSSLEHCISKGRMLNGQCANRSRHTAAELCALQSWTLNTEHTSQLNQIVVISRDIMSTCFLHSCNPRCTLSLRSAFRLLWEMVFY